MRNITDSRRQVPKSGFFSKKKMLFSKLSTKDNVLVTEALNVKLNLIIKSNIKSNAKWKDEHYII